MQLKVIKVDGTTEAYYHTKIIGTISKAFCRADQGNMNIAEELAEAVTFFVYRKDKAHGITSGEIFSVIKAVLTATGYEESAMSLSEYHLERILKRSRIEVIRVDVDGLEDAERVCEQAERYNRDRWDKSRIVEWLVSKYGLCRQSGRTIASLAEEKILGMGINWIAVSLIKQLVLSQAAGVMRAERQLQTV